MRNDTQGRTAAKPAASVRQVAAAVSEFVAPPKLCVLKTATRGDLSLNLGWQRLAGPTGINLSVTVGDMHDGWSSSHLIEEPGP